MNLLIDELFAELRTVVAELGKDGGIISPSVYDTAQVLRLYPPKEGVEPGLAWLLSEQQPDGGWGDAAVPTARDVPTLAALLTLHKYCTDPQTKDAIQAGLSFLQGQADQWADVHIDALPIAAELILPHLVSRAHQAGLGLEQAPYAPILKLRKQKLHYLANKQLSPGDAPTYSWEALGHSTNLSRDHSGGIGHSPAATATWLNLREDFPVKATEQMSERQYLIRAEAATELDIPGVVPNVWPITGFELSYGLYALLSAELLAHPELAPVVQSQSARLKVIINKGQGGSFGEYFTPDVDGTSVSLAVLDHLGYSIDPKLILQFQHEDHFCTYHNELNPSVFSNAHALYALAQYGMRYPATETFLMQRQAADGRWMADKWHSSWLYTTLEVVIALLSLGYKDELVQAKQAILRAQHKCGGWGIGKESTIVETSYSTLALYMLDKHSLLDDDDHIALNRGQQWLFEHYQSKNIQDERYWLGKELYIPYRVDRIYVLCALLTAVLERVPA